MIFIVTLEAYNVMIYSYPGENPLYGFSKAIPVFDISVYIQAVFSRYVSTHFKLKDY